MATENTRERFATLARDLLHLEITLVSHPFVDRIKAPDVKTQLVDLAESYRAEININRELYREIGLRMSGPERAAFPIEAAALAEPLPVEPDNLRDSFAGIIDEVEQDISTMNTMKRSPEAFAASRMSAMEMEMEVAPPRGESASSTVPVSPPRRMAAIPVTDATGRSPALMDNQEQKMLRIRENARQIRDILDEMKVVTNGYGRAATPEAAPAGNDLQNVEWAPENIMRIRKMWEIRPNDEIMMRTVISLDGDVIAHVNPEFAGDQYAYLHALHDQSVRVSVDFWKELIGILSDFINILVNRFSLR